MEINTIKINGSNVTALFNGPFYFFYDNYFGLVAVAERDPENRNIFTLSTGNKHTCGARYHTAIAPAVERFINRSENKYTTGNKITFVDSGKDLSDSFLSLSLKQY